MFLMLAQLLFQRKKPGGDLVYVFLGTDNADAVGSLAE